MECEVALPVCRYIAFLLEAATPSRKAIPYEKNRCGGFFVVIPKPPLLAVVIVPRGFCPKMR
ncbi:hypothetical protein FXE76_01200, partial [Vibrio cholerae]